MKKEAFTVGDRVFVKVIVPDIYQLGLHLLESKATVVTMFDDQVVVILDNDKNPIWKTFMSFVQVNGIYQEMYQFDSIYVSLLQVK